MMADGNERGAQVGDSRLDAYVAGRREWDARYGDLMTRTRNWRIAAIAAIGTLALAVAGLVYLGSRGDVIPYVVTVDEGGRVLGAGVPDRASVADDRLKKAALWDWIIAFRSVATDGVQQHQLIRRVYSRLAAGSPAEVRVSDFYRDDPPQDRAKTTTVAVEVKNILPTTPNAYEIEWTETTRDLHGTVKGERRYRGSFTVALNPPEQEREILSNPIGLYVTQLTWSEIL